MARDPLAHTLHETVRRHEAGVRGRGALAARHPAAAQAARAPAARPAVWAMDANRTGYLSVSPPGHTVAELATYALGSPDKAAAIRRANPGLADRVPAGTAVRLPPAEKVDGSAWNDFQDALGGGYILRGDASGASQIVHRFTAAGRPFELTPAQFLAMRRGSANWIARRADFLKNRADDMIWVRRDHIRGTNSVVRGISDWLGDARLPTEDRANRVKALVAQINADLVGNDAPTQQQVGRSAHRLDEAAAELDQVEHEWHAYIEGTIGGAEVATHRLTIVRNTSFAVAAGLAGAVAAPAVFTVATIAGAGTVTASGLAIAGGVVAGGTTGATLEFTGAVGGEGLATAVTPGASFDWRYVRERTAAGAKSGAISGGVGAAGALVAPGVSGALGSRFLATGVPQTLAQRIAINAATGVIVGAPSGAVSAGLEHAGAVTSGEITFREYSTRVGIGAAFGAAAGGVAGAVTSVPRLAPSGLVRPGEFPRWMIEGGPFNPRFEPIPNAPADFHNLPANQLPPVPRGYAWARYQGQWIPMRMHGAVRVPLDLRWYGAGPTGRPDFNLVTGGRLLGSQAETRPAGSTYTGARQYPMTPDDFEDPLTNVRYVRGHNVDHADTKALPGQPSSTTDPANYTPEPSWWGLRVRNPLVGQIRALSGGYRQMNYYGTSPATTANGTPIPEVVFFVRTQNGQAVAAWRIPYSYNYNGGPAGLNALPQFQIPVNELPPILMAPPPRLDAAGATSAGYHLFDEDRPKAPAQ